MHRLQPEINMQQMTCATVEDIANFLFLTPIATDTPMLTYLLAMQSLSI